MKAQEGAISCVPTRRRCNGDQAKPVPQTDAAGSTATTEGKPVRLKANLLNSPRNQREHGYEQS